jgi:hypothetical protein
MTGNPDTTFTVDEPGKSRVLASKTFLSMKTMKTMKSMKTFTKLLSE